MSAQPGSEVAIPHTQSQLVGQRRNNCNPRPGELLKMEVGKVTVGKVAFFSLYVSPLRGRKQWLCSETGMATFNTRMSLLPPPVFLGCQKLDTP